MGFYSGKRVLVAGGTGTVGVSLVPELQRRGADVTVVSLDSKVYADAVLPTGTTFIEDDLTSDSACLFYTSHADVVFDMVGIKGSTPTNQKHYSRMVVSSLRFQLALMDAAAKNNVDRYVFAGSVCAYPRMAVPKHEDSMWDGMPIQNDKYNGIVKRIGELQAQTYHDEGSWHGVRIIRLSNVYGPGDDFNPETAQVIPALIAKSIVGGEVKVHGDGSAIRDFIYAEDAAYWACNAAEELPPCTPTNISAGKGASILEVCNILQELLPVEFTFIPQSYSGDPVRILSTDRAKELLSFYERTPLREGIKKTIEWYKNNINVAPLKGKFYGK